MININYTMTIRFSTSLALIGLIGLTNPAYAIGFGDLSVNAGVEALEAGNDAEALEHFEQFLKARPAGQISDQTRFLAAEASLNQARAHRALYYLKDLEKGLPEITDYILARRGQSYRALFQWEEAINTWESLLRVWPASPLLTTTHYRIADAYFAQAKLEKARAMYRTALSLAPGHNQAPLAKFNLAHIAELVSDWREAAKIYQHFVYYRPSHPLSEVAATKLEALIKKGRAAPPSFGVRLTQVDKLLTRHSFDRAEKALEAIQKIPLSLQDQWGVQFRAAQLQYRRGNYLKARETFQTLAQRYTGLASVEYLRWLARTHSALGETEKAVAIYQTLADTYPTSPIGRSSLFKGAWLAFNGGEHIEAIRLFGLYIQRYPKDARASDAHWYKGWNAYRLGDLPTARSTLERLRQLFPTSSLVQHAHYWEGRINIQMGNSNAGLRSYNEAVRINPYNYYGTMARQRLGDLSGIGTPMALHGKSTEIASLGWSQRGDTVLDAPYVPAAEDDSFEPNPDELPEAGGLRPRSTQRLPWGGSVFNWDTPSGQRALTLLRVGLTAEAAEIVGKLQPAEGWSAIDIAYSRSLLLHHLGEHHAGLRIASQAFGSILTTPLQQKSRPFFQMAYPQAHSHWLDHSTQEFNVSPLLLLAVMRQESAFSTRAKSWASASGLLQIIPSTGRKIAAALNMDTYDFQSLQNPEVNIRFGAWYLKELLTKFKNHIILAIGSYNAGPNAVSRWVQLRKNISTDEFVEEIPYRQTRHYIRKVIGNLSVYEELYKGQPLRLPLTIPNEYLDNINF